MTGKPLLHRLPSSSRFEKRYQVHGFEHLVVEAEFEDGSEHRHPQFMYWLIRDTRFTSGLDKWARWQVLVVPTLGVVRSWLRAGGASLWDPEKRKISRDWNPIPDGWSIEEARSEVPSRTNPGIRDKRGLGGGRRRDREVRRGNGKSDLRRDPNPGSPIDPVELIRKKFAVFPGHVTSVNGGQHHYIGFGALTWLYGVNPAECVRADLEENGRPPDAYDHLIHLHPQQHARAYDEFKEELARGEDAFKLIEP